MTTTLVVTDKFAPHSGGTAVLWSEWCRCWPAENLRVVTRQFPGWQEFDRQQQYAVSRVPYLDIPKIRMPLTWLRLFAGAVRECRKRPDILHCGQILESGVYAPWLKRRYGVRYVVHTYGEELNSYGRNPRLRRWMKRVLADADAVTAISMRTAETLRTLIGYTGEVAVVYPGVNISRFAPGDGGDVRARLGIGNGPLLLTVSRLMRRKGHDRVLEALPAIQSRVSNVRYVIGGRGPDEARLRRMVTERNLTNCVTFLGHVADDDIVPLMQTADVFVHPNRELDSGDVEGFGIVFLEANACGTPVIGGNSGGAPEAIRDGETGFLVDPNSVDEIADRIVTLLDDGALREQMGAAGRVWAGKFTWEASAEKVWQLSKHITRA